MTSNASSLVAAAKQWATYYGDYANGEEGHAYTAPLRFRAAWDAADASALADVFTEGGSMLIADEELSGRQAIRDHLGGLFSGPLRGTKLDFQPVDIRMIGDGVALAVTRGGYLRPGRSELDPADAVRTTWVLVRTGGDWRVESHQTSPLSS